MLQCWWITLYIVKDFQWKSVAIRIEEELTLKNSFCFSFKGWQIWIIESNDYIMIFKYWICNDVLCVHKLILIFSLNFVLIKCLILGLKCFWLSCSQYNVKSFVYFCIFTVALTHQELFSGFQICSEGIQNWLWVSIHFYHLAIELKFSQMSKFKLVSQVQI